MLLKYQFHTPVLRFREYTKKLAGILPKCILGPFTNLDRLPGLKNASMLAHRPIRRSRNVCFFHCQSCSQDPRSISMRTWRGSSVLHAPPPSTSSQAPAPGTWKPNVFGPILVQNRHVLCFTAGAMPRTFENQRVLPMLPGLRLVEL